MSVNIMVVDDEKVIRYAFSKALGKEGYRVFACANADEALKKLAKERIDIAIVDIKMPGMSGLELLAKMKKNYSHVTVIILTAFGEMGTTVEAMKLGAYDFIVKPPDIESIKYLIEKVAGNLSENVKEIDKHTNSFMTESGNTIIGKSPAMQNIYKLIGKIALSDAAVLITGESGSGKELIARAIHENSLRADKPFIAVNCTALPASLIESEFFGHVKGAFTGAIQNRIGKFQLAHRGTLFLDEIGDMEPFLQGKLLRVLENQEVVRVGGHETFKVDVRVISATNKNLAEAVLRGDFRIDLYHRLKVISIEIPPLRERKEDIPLLIEHFLKKQKEEGYNITGISDEAMKILIDYSWPGNVRELANTIKSAVVLCRDSIILAEHLPSELRRAKINIAKKEGDNKLDSERNQQKALSAGLSGIERLHKDEGSRNLVEELEELVCELVYTMWKDEDFHGEIYNKIISTVESRIIKKALKLNMGNQVKTANMLGMSRHTLRSKLQRYKLINE